MVSQLVPVSRRGNSNSLPLLKVKLLPGLFLCTVKRRGRVTASSSLWGKLPDGASIHRFPPVEPVLWITSRCCHCLLSILLLHPLPPLPPPPLRGVLKPEKRGVNTGAMIQPDPQLRGAAGGKKRMPKQRATTWVQPQCSVPCPLLTPAFLRPQTC